MAPGTPEGASVHGTDGEISQTKIVWIRKNPAADKSDLVVPKKYGKIRIIEKIISAKYGKNSLREKSRLSTT